MRMVSTSKTNRLIGCYGRLIQSRWAIVFPISLKKWILHPLHELKLLLKPLKHKIYDTKCSTNYIEKVLFLRYIDIDHLIIDPIISKYPILIN